jgi:hypothetical protein
VPFSDINGQWWICFSSAILKGVCRSSDMCTDAIPEDSASFTSLLFCLLLREGTYM